MSVSGIFSSSFSNNQISTQYQLTNTEFQQLGQDLAAGNLSSAQSDFAILQEAFAQPSTGSASSSSSATAGVNTLAQGLQQLASDLKSGNLTAAQKDYANIQQDLQNGFGVPRWHGHHRVKFGPGGEMNGPSIQDGSSPSSASSTSAAQQTYAALAQELSQSALGVTSQSGSAMEVNPISLLA